jgi:hypothetical protein
MAVRRAHRDIQNGGDKRHLHDFRGTANSAGECVDPASQKLSEHSVCCLAARLRAIWSKRTIGTKYMMLKTQMTANDSPMYPNAQPIQDAAGYKPKPPSPIPTTAGCFIGSGVIGHASYRSASLMGGASAAWIMISAVRLNHAARAVFVVGPHPVGHGVVGSILVPALGCDVEKAVDADELLVAAREGRVGVKDLA